MKKLMWPAVIVLGIILFLGAAAGIGGILFTNRFNAEIAAMKSRGEPTTIADLLSAPVPDDRNAAVPYLQINSEIDGAGYRSALQVISKFPSSPGAHPSPDKWAEAENALSDLSPLRKRIDEALARPECRFEINTADPLSTLYPQLTTIRQMMQVTRVSALVNARNGRMDAAVEDIRTQIGITQSLKDEPFMLNHRVRMMLMRMTAESLVAVMEYGDLSEDQARRLFDALGEFNLTESCKRAWQGERVLLLHYSDPRSMRHLISSTLYSATGSASAGQRLHGPLASVYSRTAMKGDMAAYLRYSAAMMDGAGLSYRDAKVKGLLDAPRDLPFFAVLSKTVSPVSPQTSLTRYTVETRISQARVLLALQAYRDRYGAYPASMQELRSKLGWDLPKDPYSGGDLICRRQGKGFILYSVGPDLLDDGGRPIAGDRVERESKGDIVWRSYRN